MKLNISKKLQTLAKMIENNIKTSLLCFSISCATSTEAQIPEGGTPIISNQKGNFRFYPNDNLKAQIAIIQNDSTPSFVIKTNRQMEHFYSAALVFNTISDVNKNDTILLSLKARALDTDDKNFGAFILYFQRSSEPWDKSISQEIRFSKEWTNILIPFKSHDTFDTSKASLNIGVGSYVQEIELKDIQLLNYGNKFKLEDMPKTKPVPELYIYKGMEKDAEWRKEATKRIEKIRKAELRVDVTKNGNPVSDATVEIKMRRHAFHFGSAYAFHLLTADSEDAKKYREQILRLFNSGSNENDLKWQPLAGDWGKRWSLDEAMRGLEWLKKNNIYTRGHVLVWPSWRHSPKYLQKFENEPEKLKAEIEKHILELTEKCRPFINEWDVVNEPYDNNDILNILGYQIMAEWFKTARKSLPDAQLYLNDFDILSVPRGQHYEFFKNTVRELLAANAPLTGLGLQCHFDNYLHPPEEVLRDLNDLAQFGLNIKITEFDIRHPVPEIAAQYKKDFMTAIFSHPSVCGFQLWGFWAGAHWRPDAAMFTKDWQETERLKVYEELVFKQWWTNISAKTNKDGSYSTTAFLGDYDISVKVANNQKHISATLTKSGLNLKFEL